MEEETLKVKIIKIIDESPDVKSFRFVPLNNEKIDFLAGQFVFLYVNIMNNGNTETVRRPYSIASSPSNKDYIELTIKKLEGGKLTPYLHEHAKVSDIFDITYPKGNFVYTGKEGNNLALIAGGCGIVPLISIIRYIIDKKLDTNVTFLYSTKTEEDIVYKEEIKQIKENHPNIKIIHTITRTDECWRGHVGRIDEKFMFDNIKNPKEALYYLSGGLDFIRDISETLIKNGIDREKINRDVWV